MGLYATADKRLQVDGQWRVTIAGKATETDAGAVCKKVGYDDVLFDGASHDFFFRSAGGPYTPKAIFTQYGYDVTATGEAFSIENPAPSGGGGGGGDQGGGGGTNQPTGGTQGGGGTNQPSGGTQGSGGNQGGGGTNQPTGGTQGGGNQGGGGTQGGGGNQGGGGSNQPTGGTNQPGNGEKRRPK